MERIITVYNSVTQEKKVLENVEATTLGDLKAIFRQNNISFEGMDFMEGISQTKLVSDSSVLPHNIPFRGATTNDLLICMTLTDKKVKSGVDIDALDRRELLGYIKTNGLAAQVNTHFNQNYTRVPSADLKGFLKSLEKEEQAPEETTVEDIAEKSSPVVDAKARIAIEELLDILINQDLIDEEEAERVRAKLRVPKDQNSEKGYSMEDILSIERNLSL